MFQGFMRTLYVRMKTLRAKGKRALSFKEHICSLCACGQVCAWPEVLLIQAANNVLRKRLLIPLTICHLEGRVPKDIVLWIREQNLTFCE